VFSLHAQDKQQAVSNGCQVGRSLMPWPLFDERKLPADTHVAERATTITCPPATSCVLRRVIDGLQRAPAPQCRRAGAGRSHPVEPPCTDLIG